MNRVEFQSWLNAFPEDTEIHVGIQQKAPDYCPYGYVQFVKFVGIGWEDYEYTNFSEILNVNEAAWYYNKRILELGSRN